MSWVLIIIAGLIIGWIANLIMGGNGGLIYDIIIGIVGALLGRLIFFNLLHIGASASAGTFSFFGILWGVIGAIVLIVILRALKVYS